MNRRTPLIALLMSLTVALGACERKDGRDKASGATAVDNTEKNKDYDRTKSPIDQSETSSDIKLTAEIRKAVVANADLSTNAKNSKIIADKGMVTLRGAVNTQAEKTAIEAIAVTFAGAGRVSNQLEVKSP